jgi:hypothetical protein
MIPPPPYSLLLSGLTYTLAIAALLLPPAAGFLLPAAAPPKPRAAEPLEAPRARPRDAATAGEPCDCAENRR